MILPLKNNTTADYYMGVLENLDPDSKLDLIARLSQSLRQAETKEVTLKSLFGAYKFDETAEEIIADIRSSKLFNRAVDYL